MRLDAKEKIKHAVVLHSSGNSGYVVRKAYEQADGSYWIPSPYNPPIAASVQVNGKNVALPILYKSEQAAQKLCDKLNETYNAIPSNEQARREVPKAW